MPITAEEQRLHDAMRAAEDERRRWARELHDGTLQGLGALRMLLVGARRGGDPERLRDAVESAVVWIDDGIAGLRELIRELHPAALDELGAGAAIKGLAAKVAQRHSLVVETDVHLPAARYAPELEAALYRIVQEALGNAVRHAGADRIHIAVGEDTGVLRAEIHDDGGGFDPEAPADGFGLIGMRGRVGLLLGELEIVSSPSGTRVAAWLPVTAPHPQPPGRSRP
jgi:signal transduction histidine kinase